MKEAKELIRILEDPRRKEILLDIKQEEKTEEALSYAKSRNAW